MKTVLLNITTLLCAVLMVMSAIVPHTISAAAAKEDYYWPVPESTYMSQKYAGKHIGIDIGRGKDGTEIAATKSGWVRIIYTGCGNWDGKDTDVKCKESGKCSPNHNYTKNGSTTAGYCNFGYGNGVIIEHADGSGYSMYAHMDDVYVSDTGNTWVNQGDILGTMGSTGYSGGRHLHFELCSSVQILGSYYSNTGKINSNPDQTDYIYSLGVPVTLNYCNAAKTTERVYIEANKYGTLLTPSYPGYIFQGWYTKANGKGQKVSASTALISEDAHNLYAYWKACSHKNGKKNAYSGGICSLCKHEYNYKITALKSAVPYKITKKDAAPVWSRPYSNNAIKLDHIKTGSIVMVVAQTVNQAGNKWYLLSDGSWIFSDNVKKTTASNVYYVFNTDGCLNINSKAASQKVPLEQIPEGGSVIVNTKKSTKSWLYVTYNGVSGYAYKSYLTTTAPQIGIYQCSNPTAILESKKSSAKSRGTVPAHTDFVVFTNRTGAKDTYYAVYYNNEIAGYIPKKSAVKVK